MESPYADKTEWSKDKTMKLVQMLQVNGSLWNPTLCDTRRDKQKRREELRNIAEYLEVSVADATKKIQHLRTQYNREWARELRANFETPNESYESNWYAYEYLHFLKDSSKPYRILQSKTEVSADSVNSQSENICDSKVTNLAQPYKPSWTDSVLIKPDLTNCRARDDFSVFGEYVANELRSLKGEKNQLVAKKKILDIIFEVKMSTCERQEQLCTVYSNSPRHDNNIHSDKVFTTPLTTAQIEPLSASHQTPTSGMSEIIINSACSYSNFKVDTQ